MATHPQNISYYPRAERQGKAHLIQNEAYHRAYAMRMARRDARRFVSKHYERDILCLPIESQGIYRRTLEINWLSENGHQLSLSEIKFLKENSEEIEPCF